MICKLYANVISACHFGCELNVDRANVSNANILVHDLWVLDIELLRST